MQTFSQVQHTTRSNIGIKMPDKCPMCKNNIYSSRGARGSQGTDTHGDPYPFWTDDPLLTPLGLSGETYRGINPIRWIHVKELQDYYHSIEGNLGISEEDKTVFSSINRYTPVRHIHIEELRTSVEKCLTTTDYTMSDYFRYNRTGEDTEREQSDWTDVSRYGPNELPLLPTGVPIRAVHIEELRIGLLILELYLIFWYYNPPDYSDSKHHFVGMPTKVSNQVRSNVEFLNDESKYPRGGCVDSSYVYHVYKSPYGAMTLYKRNKSDLSAMSAVFLYNGGPTYNWEGICHADDEYVYVMLHSSNTSDTYKTRIYKRRIDDLSDAGSINSSNYWRDFTVSKTYVLPIRNVNTSVGGDVLVTEESTYYTVSSGYIQIAKIAKSTISLDEYWESPHEDDTIQYVSPPSSVDVYYVTGTRNASVDDEYYYNMIRKKTYNWNGSSYNLSDTESFYGRQAVLFSDASFSSVGEVDDSIANNYKYLRVVGSLIFGGYGLSYIVHDKNDFTELLKTSTLTYGEETITILFTSPEVTSSKEVMYATDQEDDE